MTHPTPSSEERAAVGAAGEAPAVVRVRIAVAVDPSGNWAASGWRSDSKDWQNQMMSNAIDSIAECEARYWIEADLAIPTSAMIVTDIQVSAADTTENT